MIKNNWRYYFSFSYRRKILDKLLEQNKGRYQGVVLDIGGREKGKFEKPKQGAVKWIFTDIEAKHNPDLVLDVADMKSIGNESIDVINATELFEHVEKIEKGLCECFRVLKPGGVFILSVPFLYPIHADPFDFQRWTEAKWKKELSAIGFIMEKFVVMGFYFTVLADIKKALIKQLPKPFSYLCQLSYPFLDLLVLLDKTSWVLKNPRLNKFHSGYFIIVCKP